MELDRLPGEDLVAKGLADLEARQETVEALLVSIGAPRLRMAGMDPPGLGLPRETVAALLGDPR